MNRPQSARGIVPEQQGSLERDYALLEVEPGSSSEEVQRAYWDLVKVWRPDRQLGEALGVTWLSLQRWESGTHAVPPFLFLALRELERQLAQDAVLS